MDSKKDKTNSKPKIKKISPRLMIDQFEDIDDYTCKICSSIVYSPRECFVCENLFCNDCISDWFKKVKQRSCPNKCDNNDHWKKPRLTCRFLSTKEVGCEYCHETYLQKDYFNHLKDQHPESENIDVAQLQKEENDEINDDKNKQQESESEKDKHNKLDNISKELKVQEFILLHNNFSNKDNLQKVNIPEQQINQHVKQCSKCDKMLDKYKFSKSQYKQSGTKRKCINFLNDDKTNNINQENLEKNNDTKIIQAKKIYKKESILSNNNKNKSNKEKEDNDLDSFLDLMISNKKEKMSAIEAEIAEQLGDIQKSDLTELILDNSRLKSLSTNDKKNIESFENLEVLCMNGVGLTTLENFPQNAHVKVLELSDNQLKDGLEFVGKFKELLSLNMAGNLIGEFDELNKLKDLKELINVDFYSNPVSEKEEYKKQFFESFPKLQSLDGYDQDGKEYDFYDDDDEEGEEEEGEDEGKRKRPDGGTKKYQQD